MHGIWKAISSFVRRADMVLLSLCVAASVFGIVVISSATNVKGSAQFVRVQIMALILGIILYVLFTLIDVDIIAERRELLLILSTLFILLLFPFGDTRSGNRSWLAFSFLPFSIQPAEICKIPFIMILAKTMSIRQNKISHISTVLRLAAITIFMFGLIVVASEDLGVALQYLFIFVIMAFVGGISIFWFLGALAAVVAASPILWRYLSADHCSDPGALLRRSAANHAWLPIRRHWNRGCLIFLFGWKTGIRLLVACLLCLPAAPACAVSDSAAARGGTTDSATVGL